MKRLGFFQVSQYPWYDVYIIKMYIFCSLIVQYFIKIFDKFFFFLDYFLFWTMFTFYIAPPRQPEGPAGSTLLLVLVRNVAPNEI